MYIYIYTNMSLGSKRVQGAAVPSAWGAGSGERPCSRAWTWVYLMQRLIVLFFGSSEQNDRLHQILF